MKIEVAITEDNSVLIRALKRTLSEFEEIKLIWTAANGREALEKAVLQTPQVILMDIEMPEMDGITATALLKEKLPTLKIIMLTSFDGDDKIFEAIQAGAAGYLLKDEKVPRIVEAIQEALEGGAPMSPAIARRTLQLLRNIALTPPKPDIVISPQHFELTKREVEILETISSGMTYHDIADQLFISYKTVRKHIENIYQKLQVHSKIEALQLAYKHNWIRRP